MSVSPLPEMTFCGVDADGVAAEWVEATVATAGQWTLICLGTSSGSASLDVARRLARKLAMNTGARVLNVGCRPAAAVDDGIAALAWLIGEGTDLERTAFIDDGHCGDAIVNVLSGAMDQGLPVPPVGILSLRRARLALSGATAS